MSANKIEKRIAEIEASFPVAVGSTEGHHGGPQNWYAFERLDGGRYVRSRFGGANMSTLRQPIDAAGEDLHLWPQSMKEAAALRAEHAQLRKQLAKLAAE